MNHSALLKPNLTVAVVGCGGIASYLVRPLVMFLEHIKGVYRDNTLIDDWTTEMYLLDPDTIEPKNLTRQFRPQDVGENKAMALRGLVQGELNPRRVTLTAVPEALSPKTVRKFRRWFLKDGLVCFACVDNHPSRILLQDEIARLNTGVLLAGGNEEHDGQVQIYAKVNGKEIVPRIDAVHPEMKSAEGRFPDDPSCQEEAESKPQLIWANMAAALGMGSVFWNLLTDSLERATDANEILFDLKNSPDMRPVFNGSVI